MLDPESTWIDEFKKLKPASTPIEGVQQLADTIEKLTNKVAPNLPGATVSPGTFQWGKALFIAQALALAPTPGPSWIPILASAWSAACAGGIITPGTVTAPSTWQVSTSDTLTLPAAAATMPTISAAQGVLEGLLQLVPAAMAANQPDKAPENMAKAFRTATLALTFTLVGISGTPASPVPTPIPAPAQ